MVSLGVSLASIAAPPMGAVIEPGVERRKSGCGARLPWSRQIHTLQSGSGRRWIKANVSLT